MKTESEIRIRLMAAEQRVALLKSMKFDGTMLMVPHNHEVNVLRWVLDLDNRGELSK